MCTYLQHLMAEFSNSLHGGGWVHSVSFSADGNRLAWVGHDSSLSVADATRGMAIYKLKTAYLPLLVRNISLVGIPKHLSQPNLYLLTNLTPRAASGCLPPRSSLRGTTAPRLSSASTDPVRWRSHAGKESVAADRIL